MKRWILVLIFFLVPASGFADPDDYSNRVIETIAVSKAQDADLLLKDFGPGRDDIQKRKNPKFMVQLWPKTVAAIVELQCSYFNGTTAVASSAIINGGTAIPINSPFDFDWNMDYRSGLCNLQATSGGTQVWTVIVKKTYNSSR